MKTCGCVMTGALCTCLMVGGAWALKADTLCWYRFENLTGSVGEVLPVGTAFADDAGSGREIVIRDFGRTAHSSALQTSKGMAVKEVKAGRGLYADAERTERLANARALAFKAGELVHTENYGSVLRIKETGSDDRIVPQTFTLEFLYNANGYAFQYDNWKSLFGRAVKFNRDSSGIESSGQPSTIPAAFEVYINGGRKLQLRYSYYDANGGVHLAPANGDVALGTDIQSDDQWHHYAVTVDQATHLATFYRDYEAFATVTLLGDICFGDYDPTCSELQEWTFGGNYFGYCMPGSFDEIRISDAALTPDRFLRIDYGTAEKVKRGETIMYLPFDSNAGTEYATKFYSIAQPELNPSPDGALEKLVDGWFDSQQFSFASQGVAETILNTRDVERGANTGCLALNVPAKATNANVGYTPTNFLFSTFAYDQLTVEMFFKAPPITSLSGWPELIRLYDSSKAKPNLLMLQFDTNRRLQLQIYGSGGGTTAIAPYQIDDGKWHHLAVTVDSSSGSKTKYVYYVDRFPVCEGTVNGAWVVNPAWQVLIGPRKGMNSGFVCNIDEFRITYGVLEPDEMLRTTPVEPHPAAQKVASSTRAWYRFEDRAQGDAELPWGTFFHNLAEPMAMPLEVVEIPRVAAGSATGTFSGPSVVSSGDDGGALMYGGVRAAGANLNAVSTGGLSDGGQKGALLRVNASSAHSLDLKTFTVEFFYQARAGEQYKNNSWPVFLSKPYSEPGTKTYNPAFEVRCDSDGLFTLQYAATVNGVKSLDQKSRNLNWDIPTDGKRHHYAFTVNDATHEAMLYIDGENKGTAKLSGSLIFNTTTGNQHWYFGGGYHGQTLKGTLDEIRISDKVLAVEEMLHYGPGKVAEGDVIAYLPLDKDFNSIAPYGGNPAASEAEMVSNQVKIAAGNVRFDPSVKCNKLGNTGLRRRGANEGSLALDGREQAKDAWCFFPVAGLNLDYFNYGKYTVEFFYKGTVSKTWEQLVGLRATPYPGTGDIRFVFLLQHDGDRLVNFRIDSPESKNKVVATVAKAVLCDGEWHHVALTLDATRTAGKTEVSCYVDYEPVGSGAIPGNATGDFITTAARVEFGNMPAQNGQTAQIDEFRIVHGILAPSQFLTVGGGMVLFVQ